MLWELLLGLALIVVLYARTINYCNLIDDGVAMKDTLYVVPTSTPPPAFFLKKSPLNNRLWAIAVHMLNTVLIYLLLGGNAALLFAVFPISVNNVAWVTGSYYSTATFLTLSAYYFLTHLPWYLSAPLAMGCFGAALNATIVTISFPFVMLFANPVGLCTFIPLVFFLFGKRFTTGIKIRTQFVKPPSLLSDEFKLSRIIVCIKVVAQYLYLTCVPIKLTFFHPFGSKFLSSKKQNDALHSMNSMFFASVALIVSVLILGVVVHKVFWVLWFLILIGAFSQYKTFGQFFAERYMYPATIGIIALFACLPLSAFWCLVGLYTMRTFMFIPMFQCNARLYENGTYWEPTEPANFCNLSDWYLLVEPDLSLAGYYAQATMKIDPDDFKPHVNMSSLFMFLKQFPLALSEAQLALKKSEGKVGEQFINIISSQVVKIQELMSEKESEAHVI